MSKTQANSHLRILVTGHLGFIGSHVVAKLKGAGHNVIGMDPLKQEVHAFNDHKSAVDSHHFEAGMFVREDVRQWKDIDVVVHLGAKVSVADSMEFPEGYVQDNSLDTAKFLSRLETHNVVPKHLIVASSMSVYGDPGEGRVNEARPVDPQSVYGLTKFDQERLSILWGRKNNIDVTALRFFNVYGPGQALHNTTTGVLANFAQAFLTEMRPTIYEDGEQTRDYVYVEDVADVILRLIRKGAGQEVYNVCTGIATTLNFVAEQLADSLGSPFYVKRDPKARDGDIRHCVGNPSKLLDKLPAWEPRTLNEGLKEYSKWLISKGIDLAQRSHGQPV